MAQRVQVPRFGNWEGDVSYTVCFDKASNGRSRGDTKRPSSHASPARAEPRSENETLTEKDLLDIKLMKIAQQQHMDVPKFGDWEGHGDDVPYTIYFEKVRERGSRGRMTCVSDKSAQDGCVPARREPSEEKYIRYRKSPRSGGIAHGEITHESENSHQGYSSASSESTTSRRSPDSNHRIDSRVGGMVKGHFVSERRSPARNNFGISSEPHLRTNTSQKDEVVPSTAFPKYVPSSDSKPSASNGFSSKVLEHGQNAKQSSDSNPSSSNGFPSKVLEHGQNAKQSAADDNSTYHSIPTKTKEQKANQRQKCCFPWCRK